MKTQILIVAILLYCISLSAQVDYACPISDKEILAFTNFIKHTQVTDEKFVINQKPVTITVEDLRFIINKGDASFSASDTLFMIKQVNYYKDQLWDSTRIKASAFIKLEEVKQLIRKTKTGSDWKLFYQKYGRRYYWISLPIFSVDRDYCVVEVGYACGDLCAESRTVIYKRDGSTWKLFKELERWVS